MTMILTPRSITRLQGVHPKLVEVVHAATGITQIEFVVLEGVRTKARQAELLKSGATTTMNSRHLTGHAVDLGAIIGGQVRWDWPLYHKIAGAMKQAAESLGTKIIWGGDWKSFPDGPHFELDRKYFP